MPRSVQFQFRQLEAMAISGPRDEWEQTRQEIVQIIEQVADQLRGIYERNGKDERAFSEEAQPVLDDARRKVEALRQ